MEALLFKPPMQYSVILEFMGNAGFSCTDMGHDNSIFMMSIDDIEDEINNGSYIIKKDGKFTIK